MWVNTLAGVLMLAHFHEALVLRELVMQVVCLINSTIPSKSLLRTTYSWYSCTVYEYCTLLRTCMFGLRECARVRAALRILGQTDYASIRRHRVPLPSMKGESLSD